MSAFLKYFRFPKAFILGGLILPFFGIIGCGPKAPPPVAAVKPATTAAKTNAVAVVQTNTSEEYTSVFEDLLPPRGKDPFFPASGRRVPVAAASTEPSAVVHTEPILVLKAIIHTLRHSQAVINNVILETGEEGQVRVPTGKIRVKCLAIGADYVSVQVEGEAEPKRLIMEQKK